MWYDMHGESESRYEGYLAIYIDDEGNLQEIPSDEFTDYAYFKEYPND